MNQRPHSRGEIRRRAAIAFATRNRSALSLSPMRKPIDGETPLSQAEVWHGVQRGLIAQPAPMRDHYARTVEAKP